MRVPLLFTLLLVTATARAEVTLQLADQKGGERALLEAAGELKDLPYHIEWHEFPAAAPLVEALNAGAVDSGPIGDAPLVFALAAGVEIRAIGASRSDPTGTAILALPDSPLSGAASLKGRRIATVRGSIGHYVLLAALQSAGLTAADVTVRFLAPSDAKAALLTGSIDAWATWEPYTSVEEVTDHVKLVVDGRGLSSGLSFQAATLSAIRDKHPALADLLHRLDRAQRWALAHEAAYAEELAALTGVPVEGARRSLHRRQQTWIPIDQGVADALQQVADTYAAAGIIARHLDASSGTDRSFGGAPPAE
jgi:sulfonate transport system substrate-binding protein